MSEKHNNHRITPPAEGERRAVSGYSGQYRVSAWIVLQHLRRRTLEWIRVADPDAGRVDDLQLGTPNRVDAYQVKWNQLAGNFSFNDLTRASSNAPSVIEQLADGWSRLKQRYQRSRVVVHLVTNDSPSKRDSPPAGSSPPTPNNFAAFLVQVWNVIRKAERPSDVVPAFWKNAWEAIRESSGLNNVDFDVFVKDCELEFEYRLPTCSDDSRESSFVHQDIQHIAHTLFDTVADPARIIELNRDALLTHLGWQERVEFISRHEFPVEERLYHPITSTIQQLEHAIETLSGGYIALLGSPGSGKSTLLTQTLRYRQSERVIRYYAYVPDSQDPTKLRGESLNFLHDIVLALEQAGFHVGESLNRFDRNQLLERLHEQLVKLHKDWQEKGRKTIILIDGLDHIEREQHPQRSLLQDLPDSEQVPDGVYIILGSQTDNLGLPSSVQHSIKQRERRIDIKTLNRQAVFDIVEKVNLQVVVTKTHKEQIFELCSGHPLALRLLLNRFQEGVSQEGFEQILDKTEEFTGDIESYYHSYWRQIVNDDQLSHLFGLLARVRGLIDLTWFGNWYNCFKIDQLRRTAYQFFKREDVNRWYFFHNSFRVFIINKTREIPPDGYDPSRDITFHHELAEQYAQSPDNSPLRWEELYHRIASKEHDIVLQRATQAWFRSQFFAYRSIDDIKTDIQLALKSALVKNDVVALCRLILAGAELSQRAYSFGSDILPSMFLGIGDYRLAFEHTRTGNRLRVGAHSALELSHELYLAGYIDEALRIFELSEPLDILSGSQEVREYHREDDELLITWAEVAVYFRDIKSIIAAIRHVRVSRDDRRDEDPEQLTQSLQNYLLLRAGLALLDEAKWDELQQVIAEFDLQNPHHQRYWLSLHIHIWEKCSADGDHEKARQFLGTVLQRADELHIEDDVRTRIAEAIYHILSDQEEAWRWFVQVSEPELQTNIYHTESGINPFMKRFRYFRLRYLFGERREHYLLIPNAAEPRNQGIVFFERSLCVIAKIWADAWRQVHYTPTEIDREIFPLLRLFNRDWRDKQYWSLWFLICSSRGEFYGLLIRAVAAHGQEAIEGLRVAFDREWQGEEKEKYWPTNLCREIILNLYHIGIDRNWVVQHLSSIEQTMLERENVSGRIEECKKQAHAWIAVKDIKSAKRNIDQLLHVTFSVDSEEDYQLDSWIEWVKKINVQEPEHAIERIVWFARGIVSLEEHAKGGATNSAACNLLELTFAHSPRRCVRLFEWFFEKRVTGYSDSLYAMLKAALQFPNPPIQHIKYVLCDFLLPYASELHTKLSGEFINRVADGDDADFVTVIVQYMLSKVDVYALPEMRPFWRNVVANALQRQGIDIALVGLHPEDLVTKSYSSGTSDIFTLNDGTELTFSEAEERASTPSGLIKLLQNTARDSYFHWEKVVERLADNLFEDDIRNLSTLFEERNRNSQVFAILSERLSALGAFEEAWRLGEKALETSSPYGWSITYDGGTRLSAFQALNYADSNRVHRMAFETLVNDLTGEFRHPERIALHLHQILPFITDEVPHAQVWDAVFDHVQMLFDKIPLIDDTPDIEYEATPDIPEFAFIDMLLQFVNHHINVLAQAAQRAVAKLLLDYDEATQHVLIESLKDEYNDTHEPLIIVLEAVSCINPNTLKPFEETILQLYASPSYEVRRAAKHICERVGWKEPEPLFQSITLPSIYNLSLSTHGTGRLISQSQIHSTEPIPDSDNPKEIIQPFGDIYDEVAQEVGIPFTNICYRAVQIMGKLSPQEHWSAQGERKLRSSFESAGLRMSFTRPRASLARLALFHMIAELLDAGRLDHDSLSRLERELRFYDPNMLLTEPVKRPSFISSIQSSRSERGSNDEWCEQVTQVNSAMVTKTEDGNIILGEYAEFRCLEQGVPTEIRGQVVSHEGKTRINVNEVPRAMFENVSQLLKDEYASIRIGSGWIPIVIHNNAYKCDTLAANWLALNPTIGESFGWRFVKDGLFRWVDEEVNLMAETIWWSDGLLQQGSLHLYNVVGEGWLVVASDLGWQKIRGSFNDLKRINYIKREYTKQEQLKIQRDTYSEEKL